MTEAAAFTDKQLNILRKAVDMLGRKDFSKITTAQLAKELQVSESALYRHFYTKERIVYGIVDFIEQTITNELRHILEEEENSLATVTEMMGFLLNFLEHNPGMARILSREALFPDYQDIAIRVTAIYENIESSFESAIIDCEPYLPDTNAETLAKLMVAIFDYGIQSWLRHRLDGDLHDTVQDLWESFLMPYADALNHEAHAHLDEHGT